MCVCHPCGVPKVPYRVWYQYRVHSNSTASQSICQTAASLAISVVESEPDPEGFGAFAAGDGSLNVVYNCAGGGGTADNAGQLRATGEGSPEGAPGPRGSRA